MRRINYLVGWSERSTGVALPTAVPPRLRAPLAALAAALALVVTLWAVQSARLRAAEHDGAAYADRLATMEVSLARAHSVERDIARLRALRERVGQIRRSGEQAAGEIARLGNRLPDDAWLTSLRAERTVFAIEGRGARLDTVGATLDAFARPPNAGARLVALHRDPVRSGVTYAIELERGR